MKSNKGFFFVCLMSDLSRFMTHSRIPKKRKNKFKKNFKRKDKSNYVWDKTNKNKKTTYHVCKQYVKGTENPSTHDNWLIRSIVSTNKSTTTQYKWQINFYTHQAQT